MAETWQKPPRTMHWFAWIALIYPFVAIAALLFARGGGSNTCTATTSHLYYGFLLREKAYLASHAFTVSGCDTVFTTYSVLVSLFITIHAAMLMVCLFSRKARDSAGQFFQRGKDLFTSPLQRFVATPFGWILICTAVLAYFYRMWFPGVMSSHDITGAGGYFYSLLIQGVVFFFVGAALNFGLTSILVSLVRRLEKAASKTGADVPPPS